MIDLDHPLVLRIEDGTLWVSKLEFDEAIVRINEARNIAENLKHRLETPRPDNPCSQIVGPLPWMEGENE